MAYRATTNQKTAHARVWETILKNMTRILHSLDIISIYLSYYGFHMYHQLNELKPLT